MSTPSVPQIPTFTLDFAGFPEGGAYFPASASCCVWLQLEVKRTTPVPSLDSRILISSPIPPSVVATAVRRTRDHPGGKGKRCRNRNPQTQLPLVESSMTYGCVGILAVMDVSAKATASSPSILSELKA